MLPKVFKKLLKRVETHMYDNVSSGALTGRTGMIATIPLSFNKVIPQKISKFKTVKLNFCSFPYLI